MSWKFARHSVGIARTWISQGIGNRTTPAAGWMHNHFATIRRGSASTRYITCILYLSIGRAASRAYSEPSAEILNFNPPSPGTSHVVIFPMYFLSSFSKCYLFTISFTKNMKFIYTFLYPSPTCITLQLWDKSSALVLRSFTFDTCLVTCERIRHKETNEALQETGDINLRIIRQRLHSL